MIVPAFATYGGLALTFDEDDIKPGRISGRDQYARLLRTMWNAREKGQFLLDLVDRTHHDTQRELNFLNEVYYSTKA